MSLITQLHEVEQAILARLRELEPLAREYEELRQEALRLGLDVPPAADAKPVPSSRRRAANASAPPSTRRTAGAGGPGGRDQQVLALVAERPGITVAQVGKQLEVDPSSLYRVIRRLCADGRLRKKGRHLHAS